MRIPRRVLRPLSLYAFLVLLSSLSPSLRAQSQPQPATGPQSQQPQKIDWKKGPFTAKLADFAEIKVPEGYEFADGDGARKYLENTGNPPGTTEVGIITPIADDKDNDWWILFDFDQDGYVNDDEKGSINASAILDDLKKDTEADNVERKKRGWTPFHLTGWQTQPFYDETTHNLTWATLGNTDNPKQGITINYSTRLLGRRGVMRVDLITDPQTVAATLPRYKSVMSSFAFLPGSRYVDFVKGDKVATYGLTALIAGGATAVVMKTGLLAKMLALLAALWKFIAVGCAALMTRIKQIIAGIKNKFRRNRPGMQGDSD